MGKMVFTQAVVLCSTFSTFLLFSCGFRLCHGVNKAKYMENERSDSLPIQQEAKNDA